MLNQILYDYGTESAQYRAFLAVIQTSSFSEVRYQNGMAAALDVAQPYIDDNCESA